MPRRRTNAADRLLMIALSVVVLLFLASAVGIIGFRGRSHGPVPRPSTVPAPSVQDELASADPRAADRDASSSGSGGINPRSSRPETSSPVDSVFDEQGSAGNDAAATDTVVLGAQPPRSFANVDSEAASDQSDPASIWGFVTNSEGQPVASVLVLVEGSSDAAWSDERGYYRIARLASGEVTMKATPPRDSHYLPPAPQTIELAGGEDRGGVNFVLYAEGDFIAGYVRNLAGDPIAGAEVAANLGGASWNSASSLQTDSRGYFRIDGVTPGKAIPWLRAMHPEYESETRLNVTAWDGEQLFVLKKVSNLTLRATWAFDGSPVTLYGYRLLKKGFNDFDYDVGRAELIVENPQGVTALEKVETGEWHVEVTVLGENNAVTDIRGAVDFEIAEGGENREINVQITSGRIISGVVIDAEQKPVPEAEVEIIPPPRWPGLGLPPPSSDSQTLDFPKTYTDGTGFFEYQGMPPGKYTVWVTKDTMRTTSPTDVIVLAERDPDLLRIKLIPGGVIYGRVIGFDGNPLANARIRLPQSNINYSGTWRTEEQVTDSDGNYRFDGLSWGIHWLYLYAEKVNGERKIVDLTPGEEFELDWDLSQSVDVSGTVYVGNTTAKGGNVRFMLDGRNSTAAISIDSSGTYRTKLLPGTYWPRISLYGEADGELPDSIEVTAQPQSQNHDLHVELADVDVLLIFPPDAEFERGNVAINLRDMKTMYQFNRLDMAQEFKRAPGLIAGEYMATFTSESRTWEGDSGWVQVNPGQENTITIDVKQRVRGERVGGWVPEQVPTTGTTLSFDLSHLIHTKSDVEVLVTYEKGRYGVNIDEVSITANGGPFAIDQHRGWSGVTAWANTYRLRIDPFIQNTRYVLNIKLSTDGGMDSTGSIFVTVQ